jgi:hypothetical protein
MANQRSVTGKSTAENVPRIGLFPIRRAPTNSVSAYRMQSIEEFVT